MNARIKAKLGKNGKRRMKRIVKIICRLIGHKGSAEFKNAWYGFTCDRCKTWFNKFPAPPSKPRKPSK
jgi:hypothetical protein